MSGLEQVFANGHEYATRIFYDAVEGQYYDRATDLYLTLQEAASFGVK